jgi:diketogulonate reductase-like aldo/keto reductase
MTIEGIRVPRFLYGTAWKENETQRLVELAIEQGFRGIDTANQRRHYDEASVGRGIASAISSGRVARNDLFLQTKFTFQRGQDHRLPYDPSASISKQVEQSLASSVEHLGVVTIDSYLLHGPTQQSGLAAADWEVWKAMEFLHDSGRVRLLGISNFAIDQLEDLYRKARVRPSFVQNRCYVARNWDRRIRQFCADYGMVYQAQPRYAPGNNTITGYIAGIAQGHPWSGATFMYELAHCPTANDDPHWVAAHGALTESTVTITRTLTLYFEGVVVYGPLLVYGPVAG